MTLTELKELARRFGILKNVANTNRVDYQEGFYRGYRDGYRNAHQEAF